jgi:hypothetical protein
VLEGITIELEHENVTVLGPVQVGGNVFDDVGEPVQVVLPVYLLSVTILLLQVYFKLSLPSTMQKLLAYPAVFMILPVQPAAE